MEAFADTKSILEETVHLVERQFPKMETELVYRRLSYMRVAQFRGEHLLSPTESLE
jgi:hypothetical protein